MDLGKWEVLFWFAPRSWLWSKGVYPNRRELEFRFWNFGAIELRHYGAFKKKVCKRCGQDLPASNTLDKEV